MLRFSEIKPLFVDLSLCDKSFSFLCICGGVYLRGFFNGKRKVCVCPVLSDVAVGHREACH